MNDTNDTNVNQDSPDNTVAPTSNIFKRCFKGYWRHKKWTIVLTILLVVGAVFAVPWSRYAILGQFVEKSHTIKLIDIKTNAPISGATLTIDGNKAVTDAKGEAKLRANVGKRNLKIDKKYYNTSTKFVFVGLASQKSAEQVQLVATGRQVPIVVINKITGKPLANATLKAVGTEVKTDKDGKAVIVLPADKPTLPGTLTAKGFNDIKLTIQVTETVVKDNSFQLVSTGKLYFLSRLSGKVDVVKTNLDGSNRETVIAGTGKEDDRGTVLLASRDWKYLALQSKRESGPPKLYLIETETDKMTTMDEGDAVFTPIGWNNHTFAYQLLRNTTKEWQPNHQSAKSYDADKQQVLTLDQTEAEGDISANKYQLFSNFYLLGDQLAYTVQWSSYSGSFGAALSDKQSSIRTVSLAAQNKKDLKNFAADKYNSFQAVLYKPSEVYFAVYSQTTNGYEFYELEADVVKPATIDQNKFFNDTYDTYLSSPSGNKVFWSEQRDGRDTFFVGDKEAENSKQVAALEEFQVYGWYGDDYLLVSKKGSELYILPATGGTELKVTDYHKPVISFRGYGGGYGGL